MFTLQTSFKPLLLGGGPLIEVTLNSKEEKLLILLSQLRPRIRPQSTFSPPPSRLLVLETCEHKL
jgi:hypothetical protein